MFLFLVICAIILGLIVFGVTLIGIFGAGFTIIFSDIIVCIALFVGLGYLIRKRKEKKANTK